VDTKPIDLVGYCGAFCGKCGISGAAIGVRLDALRALLEAAGFAQEAERLGWPAMRDIATCCCAQFEGQVGAFAELAGRIFPTHCRGGCHPCGIADCCRGKGFTTCAECADFEGCERFGERHGKVREDLRAIGKAGLETWAAEQHADVLREWRRKLVQAVAGALDG